MPKKIPTKKNNPEIEIEIAELENELDPFAYLFSEYDPEIIVVTLARLEPDIWQGINIKGYLCKLTPGHDEEWIKNIYGGGKYILNKKNYSTGRILGSKTIVVSGNPKIGSISTPIDPVEESGNDFDNFVPDGFKINVGGTEVPYNGDLQKMKDLILFLKAVNSAFPPPVDYNAHLLQALIESKSGSNKDPLEMITQIKQASELFQPAEKGGNIYDVITEGIKSAGNILGGLTSLPKLKNPPIMKTARQITSDFSGSKQEQKQVKGLEIASNVDNNNETVNNAEPVEQVENEVKPMSEGDIVLSIAGQVVKGYRLIPAMEPRKLVHVIDLFLRQKDSTARSFLVNRYSSTLFDACEMELQDDWSDPESKIGSREDFKPWYDKIFEIYADPDREVLI